MKREWKTNTVYALYDESMVMAELFPNHKKIKTIRKDDIVGERVKNISMDWEDLDFMFRNDFENCPPEIKGDIIKYIENRKWVRSSVDNSEYYWGRR